MKLEYIFKPWHLLVLIVFIVKIWAWTTGYEYCVLATSECEIVNPQSIIRTATIMFGVPLFALAAIRLAHSNYSKKITFYLPIKSKFGPGDPDWEEYQEWLKTRDKNEYSANSATSVVR